MLVIQENVSLLPFNTFRIDIIARYYTCLQSLDDARDLISSRIFQNNVKLFLGGGSNILFTKPFNGIAIKNEIRGIETEKESEDHITLRIGSGENWHELVLFCVANNYGGIENLSLIPGTVGAAPMQNIGAYGVEVKDVIDHVHAIDISTGSETTFSKAECKFGYRESIFKHEAKEKYFISSVTLTLTKRNHQLNVQYGAIQETLQESGVTEITIKSISDAVINIRKKKLPDPAVIGNAGSFFKNPSIPVSFFEFLQEKFPSIPGYKDGNNLIKVPAGWLIEHCGWKGKTFYNIGVHSQQALVLVNYGGGEGEKIWALAMDIQTSVKEKFNVLLQPEVNIL